MHYNSESGRSMVEMLGTLAIIGILSVAGIAGYQAAINRYRANEVIDNVNKRAVIIAGSRINQTQTARSNLSGKIIDTYSVTEKSLGDQFFSIIVSDLPKEVCQSILGLDWQLPISTYVNNVIYTGDSICTETNNFNFEFTNNLSPSEEKPTHCKRKSDCSSGCDDCIQGVCLESCPSGSSCGINILNAHNKTCCTPDKMVDGFCCHEVSSNESGKKTCCTSWGKLCCPPGQFMPNKGSGKCIDCSSEETFYFPSGQSCAMCPNRVIDSAFYCRLTCPEGMIEVNGNCKCPIDKPLHGVNHQGGKCFACDEGDDSGYVWDNPIGMNGVGTACNWCNFNYGGGYCWRCPKGKVAVGGSCTPCDDPEINIGALKYKSQCESCNGTWEGKWNDGKCTPPPSPPQIN